MFTKILLTVAVVALIWFGFAFFRRVSADNRLRDVRQGGGKEPPVFRPDPDGAGVQDLIKCPACSTWRSAKLGSCGRGGCPY